MEVPKKRTRFFGACILFFMVVLALATAVLAASSQWNANGSYASLVIQKQFATEVERVDENGNKVMVSVPQAVLDEAKKQTYRFHIEGYRLDESGNKIPIDDIVEIGPNSTDWELDETESGVLRWKLSEELKSDGPIYVSVTEITNGVTLTVNGVQYNMGDSYTESTTLFKESPQVQDLNNNGKIVLSRPGTKRVEDGNGGYKDVPVTTTSTFRIKSEWPWDDKDVVKPPNWTAYDKVVTLKPGEAPIELTGLQAGRYTIEDLSVSGYTITLGARKNITVAPKETGTFYINNKPGKLVITAGGTAGDNDKHYFTVKRVEAPSGAQPFEDRTTEAVLSGETYTLDNLPRGKYEVTEYTFSGAPTPFKVKVPEIEDEGKSFTFTNYTPAGQTITRYFITMGGDYVDGFRYGPIYDKNGKMLSETDLYDVRYIANWLQADGTTSRDGYKASNRKGNYYYTLNDTIIPGTGSQRLAFGVGETAANKGGYCLLKWVEHTRKTPTYTAKNANTNYTITVDDWGVPNSGWMEIKAPKIESSGAEQVTYTYELRKTANGAPLKTLELEPDQTGTFENLAAGSYLVKETVNIDGPVASRWISPAAPLVPPRPESPLKSPLWATAR